MAETTDKETALSPKGIQIETTLTSERKFLYPNLNISKSEVSHPSDATSKNKIDDVSNPNEERKQIDPQSKNKPSSVHRSHLINALARRSILETDPLQKRFEEGNVLATDQDYLAAVEHYEELLREDLSEYGQLKINLLFNLGWVYAKLRNSDRAIEFYDEVLKLEPKFCDALTNRGNELLRLRRYDEAIEAYKSVLDFNSRHTQATNNLKIAQREKYSCTIF
mmetsp:Transcript_43283/g.49769  ORF Transcript_43283/g.49769 Transcript_43283/m.49769 type:complete len:223 (+) Transcript_43283:59-727(+)